MSEETWVCSICGAENSAEAEVCRVCGSLKDEPCSDAMSDSDEE